MFRFEHIDNLVFLILIPLMVLIYFVGQFLWKKKRANFGNAILIDRLLPSLSFWKKRIKLIFLCLSVLFLVIAWANPQWGYKKESVKVKSTEVFIALDISLSMLSEDISPNRLERAKRFTQRLAQNLRGEKIGLILFAGSAYLQVPITNDIAAVQLFLKSASTSMAGTQGTNIAEAIQFAEESFSQDNKYKKALIVMTDGENHEEEAINKAREVSQKGIIIHTIGVGTSEGGYIPVIERGKTQYKKDELNRPIKTALNIQMLKDLATAGNGKSYLINDEDKVIESIKAEINRMEKIESDEQSFSDYNSYFQYFLFFGILFFIIEFLLNNRKRGYENV